MPSDSLPSVAVPSAPALTPAPTAEPSATGAPSAPGLTVDSPVDGAFVRGQSVVVFGYAPPGATVTRDIPLWPDDHTTADVNGFWKMSVPLNSGENPLKFRIGDDHATERVVRVVAQP